MTIVGGAGTVGSCAAFRIAQDGFASEIVMVDPRRNLAEAHALDIEQAVVHRTKTQVRAGEIKDTTDSDVVIMAVSVLGLPPTGSRAKSLEQNLKLMTDVMRLLIKQSPSAFWIIVTNPVDVLLYLIHRIFSISREKIIGLNRNDTSRLRWAIGKVLSVPATDVEAFVLGEHGETQVNVFSHIRIHGEKVSLNAEQRKQVTDDILNFVPQWIKLQPGRTAGWTTAESIGDILTSTASGDGRIWACSTPLEGEYGLRDVSLAVPVRLGTEGVKEIIEFDLDPAEINGLKASAEIIQERIKQGQVILDGSIGALDEMLTLLKRR